MSSTTSPKMLTTQERTKMQSSTSLTVAVGPKKKLYFLPKSIVSHYYSPHFACTLENTKKLELLGETTDNFDVIVDYMMRNIIPGEKNANSKRTIDDNKDTIAQCLRFLEFADKYELGDVSEVLYGPLSKAICDLSFHKKRGDSPRSSKVQKQCGIEGSDIERIFSLCPAGSRLRTLAAQASLSFSGPQALDTWSEQTENVPGFAGELMGQLATSFQRQQWMDPVIKQKRQ
ncbi:uncharacterized protein PAC_04395 [Phialocephala subalpina]|uniref:BTB domain-containing protein n=1 Tax=Phialocephala subalpina TaxID=576137 RepID=A0A1L7WP33_9HELO|nr:uncharacterized protein PAC_04395 [Phialocephala subalpina]